MSTYTPATIRKAIDYLDGLYRDAVVKRTIKEVYVTERTYLVSII
jgi:hypothetical protein